MILSHKLLRSKRAAPGRSVGCASAWHADVRGFNPRVRQHSFVVIGHENIFYSYSLPTAYASRTVVSYWRNDLHLVLVNRSGSLPRNSVVRSRHDHSLCLGRKTTNPTRLQAFNYNPIMYTLRQKFCTVQFYAVVFGNKSCIET